jgi:hypothetical protein
MLVQSKPSVSDTHAGKIFAAGLGVMQRARTGHSRDKIKGRLAAEYQTFMARTASRSGTDQPALLPYFSAGGEVRASIIAHPIRRGLALRV